MSHTLGPLVPVARIIGPNSGLPGSVGSIWTDNLSPNVSVPEHGSVKFVILHFTNAIFPGNNRLEISLGNGQTDIFNAGSGNEFYSRPIKVTDGSSIEINYFDDGSNSGGVNLFEYGQGEEFDSGVILDSLGNNTVSNKSKTNPDVFLWNEPYQEPIFETRGGGTRWENVSCITPSSNPLINAAKSVGIILMIHDNHVSSCSGTLIEPDLFLTAGHCFNSAENLEVRSGSVCFEYSTNCDSTRPSGYAPKFFKIKERISLGLINGYDYALLRLEVPIEGIGVPHANIRLDLPSIGESVFAIHHPNATVKKISLASALPRINTISEPESKHFNLTNVDLKGGSSGSGLFDANGNYLGINAWENRANSINSILRRVASSPTPETQREVMIVFDRSGSMNGLGLSGEKKIDEAKDAVSLFVQLIREGFGDKIGMVSFSTSASNPVDFSMQPITNDNKVLLVGGAPYSSGIVGGLTAGGLTSIGDGIQSALTQFGSDSSDKVILLLTDGLQNTSPLIQSIEASLGTTRMCIIGFGTEANLDGAILTRLAWQNNGSYAVARNDLELKKFFAICFGEIFGDEATFDPFYTLSPGEEEASLVDIFICEEEDITVVLGWDKPENILGLQLISPGGKTISKELQGVTFNQGRTWAFMRIKLPFEGEREGVWKVKVFRNKGSINEFELPNFKQEVKYFLNVTAKGGAKLKNITPKRKLYTGDVLFPQLILQYPNNTIPENIKMDLILTSPNDSIGNLVIKEGLKSGNHIAGDIIYPLQATLKELEAKNGGVLVNYSEQVVSLSDELEDNLTLEPNGIYGKNLDNITLNEGHYSFKVNATYGKDCTSTREVSWSTFIHVGIDIANTVVEKEILEVLPSGKKRVRISFTPKDKYGNYLGPAKQLDFKVFPSYGNEKLGGLTDLDNGTYSQEVLVDASASSVPGIIIVQDDRPPVLIETKDNFSKTKIYFWLLLILLIILFLIFIWLFFSS